MRTRIFLTCFAIALASATAGCFRVSLEELGAPGSGGSVVSGATKSLASSWQGKSGAPELDFQAYRPPSTQKLRFELENGASCVCTASSGTGGVVLQLTQCQNAAGIVGENGCAALVDRYTIVRSATGLEICDSSGGCNQFQ